MFIVIYSSVDEYGEVDCNVVSSNHMTYQEAQSSVRQLIETKIEEEDLESDNVNDSTDYRNNSCVYISDEEGDSVYKILEV